MYENKESLHDKLIGYVNLKIDQFKLSLVARMARLSSHIIVAMIMSILFAIAILMISVAIVLLVAYMVKSMVLALLFVSIGLILIALILYCFRQKLYLNSMVRLFVALIFEDGYEKNV